MKRNFLKMIAITGVLLGAGLSASAAEHLRVNVPFTFVLAGLEFQPGQYTVNESNNGVLTVTGEGRGAMVMTIPAEMKGSAPTGALHFVKDGPEYHLVGVQTSGDQSRAVDSQTYREHRLSIASR